MRFILLLTHATVSKMADNRKKGLVQQPTEMVEVSPKMPSLVESVVRHMLLVSLSPRKSNINSLMAVPSKVIQESQLGVLFHRLVNTYGRCFLLVGAVVLVRDVVAREQRNTPGDGCPGDWRTVAVPHGIR